MAWRLCLVLLAGLTACTAADTLAIANEQYRMGRFAQAVESYKEYLRSNPDRADVHVYLGASLLGLNRPDEALSESRKAIDLQPGYAKAWLLAGRAHASTGNWSISEQFLRKAVELQPEDRDAWYFLGRAAQDGERYDTAADALRRAIQLGRSDAATYENLGRALEGLNQAEAAEAAFRNALAKSAMHPPASLAYGAFLYRQGRLAESVIQLEAAFAGQQSPSAEVRFELARALHDAGDLKRALTLLEPLRASGDCRILAYLSKLYREAGTTNPVIKFTDCSASIQRGTALHQGLPQIKN